MNEEIYYRSEGYDEHYKVWHTSGRNMIIYMYSDGGSLVCGKKTFPIRKGALCFVGADMYHYTMPENPDKYVRSKLFVTNEELRAMLSVLLQEREETERFDSESFIYAQVPNDERTMVDALFYDVHRFRESKQHRAVKLGSFLRLLACIEENKVEAISPESDFMNYAIDYINAHIAEDISIEDICDAAHVSKYHFCREFKKRTGQTVMEYILATRIVLAKEMLQKTDLTVGEISERCGFSGISYFCRVFKQDTGKTPLGFRKSGV